MPINKNPANSYTPINPIIGDEGYQLAFNSFPNPEDDQDLLIKTHLRHAEQILRVKSPLFLSPEALQRRESALNYLNEYWHSGIFPRNLERPGQRLPCFIDSNKRICAVGFLVERTAGREVAEEINRKFQYDFVMDMNDPLLDKWIIDNGFSKTEIATIQPAYDFMKIKDCKWPI